MWEASSAFWSARDAWRAAVEQRQATQPRRYALTPAGRMRVPTLAEQRYKWEKNAAVYLANRPKILALANGAAKLQDDTPRLVADLVGRIAPRLAAAYDLELSRVAFNAFKEWPVLSGLSKSSITLSYFKRGEFEFVGAIGNSAPYASFIKGNPAATLLRQPTKRAAAAIAAGVKLG